MFETALAKKLAQMAKTQESIPAFTMRVGAHSTKYSLVFCCEHDTYVLATERNAETPGKSLTYVFDIVYGDKEHGTKKFFELYNQLTKRSLKRLGKISLS